MKSKTVQTKPYCILKRHNVWYKVEKEVSTPVILGHPSTNFPIPERFCGVLVKVDGKLSNSSGEKNKIEIKAVYKREVFGGAVQDFSLTLKRLHFSSSLYVTLNLIWYIFFLSDLAKYFNIFNEHNRISDKDISLLTIV